MIVCFEGIDGSGKSTQAKLLVQQLNEKFKDNNKSLMATYFSITDYAKAVATTDRPHYSFLNGEFAYFDYKTITALVDQDVVRNLCNKINLTLVNIKECGNGSWNESYLYDRLATLYIELARKLFKVISDHDNKGRIIVLDRWLYSTIAYNAAKEGTLFNRLLKHVDDNDEKIGYLTDLFHKIVKPDVIFYMNTHPDDAKNRLLDRASNTNTKLDVFEEDDYLNEVSKAYKKLLLDLKLKDRTTNELVDIYPKNIYVISSGDIEEIRSKIMKIFKEVRI